MFRASWSLTHCPIVIASLLEKDSDDPSIFHIQWVARPSLLLESISTRVTIDGQLSSFRIRLLAHSAFYLERPALPIRSPQHLVAQWRLRQATSERPYVARLSLECYVSHLPVSTPIQCPRDKQVNRVAIPHCRETVAISTQSGRWTQRHRRCSCFDPL